MSYAFRASLADWNGMVLILYELCGANDLRFSPFCWRTRLALIHKGLEFETVPVKFTEKHKIEFSGQDKVPVINDYGTVVSDSWLIAEYLEDTYPERPALFSGSRGRHYAKMTNDWMDRLNPLILRAIILDIYEKLDPLDKVYFRKSREARFGMKLEKLHQKLEDSKSEFHDAMAPMRAHLMDRPYVSGSTPAYGDFSVFGSIRWMDLCGADFLLAETDPISDWYTRLNAHVEIR